MKTDGTKEEITDLKGMVEQRIPIPWTGRRKSEALGIKSLVEKRGEFFGGGGLSRGKKLQ